MTTKLELTDEQFRLLYYSAREAQIRFKRERTRLHRHPEESSWTREELNEEMAKYKAVEEWLDEVYREQNGKYFLT